MSNKADPIAHHAKYSKSATVNPQKPLVEDTRLFQEQRQNIVSELTKPARVLQLQRLIGNRATRSYINHVLRPRSANDRIQRVYLKGGEKFTGEMISIDVSGVKVISYANRHTILGLITQGTMKALNTVLLEAVEMNTVAQAAYAAAWKEDEGRVRVTDGTTFLAAGIEWGIDARPNEIPPSIHVYPIDTPGKTFNMRTEKPSLNSYLSKRKAGESHEDALAFAKGIAQKTNASPENLTLLINALITMGEIAIE